MNEYSVNPVNQNNQLQPVISYAQYGSSLIPSKNLALLRGSGAYNPGPLYEQTTNRGPAYSSALLNYEIKNPVFAKSSISHSNYDEELDSMNKRPYTVGSSNFHPEEDGSWSLAEFEGSRGSDQYQSWALRSTNIVPNPLLNFFFSDDNVQYLQNYMKSEVKRLRDVDIRDQSIDELLIIMRNKYIYALSGYLPITKDDTVYNRGTVFEEGSNKAFGQFGEGCMSLEFQIKTINKAVLDDTMKMILGGIDAYKEYYKDASSIPMPMSRPVLTTGKGSRVLQENLGFESAHEMNTAITSYSQRFTII